MQELLSLDDEVLADVYQWYATHGPSSLSFAISPPHAATATKGCTENMPPVPPYCDSGVAVFDFAASLSESCERPSRWVPPERTLPTAPLTMLLAELGPFLSRRGQANSGKLLFWFAFFVSARYHAL